MSGPNNPKQDTSASKSHKKKHGWIGFLRLIIYIISIAGSAIGANLIQVGSLSSSYADGTYAAKIQNGEIIFFASLIVLSTNIMWGILRWFLRGYHEKWRPGCIIGKLIGGGIWRAAVILPLVFVSFFVIAPLLNRAISDNVLSAQKDFIAYDPDATEHRLEYLDEHFDELDPALVYQELRELALLDIEFDPNYTASSQGFNLFSTPVYATTKNAIALTHAKLSPSQKFIVFYTTSGDDAITDEDAENLAIMFDDVIASYKDNLGLEYSYAKKGGSVIKSVGMTNILKANNISTDILDSAMPIYVADPFRGDSNVLASYAGEAWTSITTKIIMKLGQIPLINNKLLGMDDGMIDSLTFYDSVPSYPFVNIGPRNIHDPSLKSTVAHELGHHYDDIYKFNTYGEYGRGEKFIKETIANWMAANVVSDTSETSVINGGHYNRTYLAEGSDLSVNLATPDFLGYPPYAFLENYSNIVPNATTIMLDATYYGDALNYLYKEAGAEKFAKVMTSLAEKNLTGDYNGKLTNYVTPPGDTLSCADACTNSYEINPAATGYVYFSVAEYKNTEITFNGEDPTIAASFLGKTLSGKWIVLDSGKQTTSLEITEETPENYEVLALAVSNSSIEQTGNYTVSVISSALEEIIDTEGDFAMSDLEENELFTYIGGNCYRVNLDSIFNLFNDLVNLGSEFVDLVDTIDGSDESANLRRLYDAQAAEATKNLESAHLEASAYDITFCASEIKNGQSFAAAKSKLQSALGHTINIYNGSDGSTRFSVFVNLDMLRSSAKSYLLIGDDSGTGFIVIDIKQK